MKVHVSPLKMLITLQPYKDPNGLYTVTEDLWVRNQIPNWKYVPVNSLFLLLVESAAHLSQSCPVWCYSADQPAVA